MSSKKTVHNKLQEIFASCSIEQAVELLDEAKAIVKQRRAPAQSLSVMKAQKKRQTLTQQVGPEQKCAPGQDLAGQLSPPS